MSAGREIGFAPPSRDLDVHVQEPCVGAMCRQNWCRSSLLHTAECTRVSTASVGMDAASRHLLRTGLRSYNLSISIAEQMVSHPPCYFSFQTHGDM